MRKLLAGLIFSAAAILSVEAAGLQAGKGVANTPATGDSQVTFVTRGNGNQYGWRGWDMAVGLTILPWTLPNDESNVYGLRLNLGWGKYAKTYGIDLGAFSASRFEFGGIAANLFGNAVAGTMGGLQVGAVNVVKSGAYGVQIGFVNFAEDLNGVQIGALNFNASGVYCLPIINVGF
jgi:hypothetical protein